MVLDPNWDVFDRILASEYLRAQQTALLLSDTRCETWGLLNEFDYPYDFETAQEYTEAIFRKYLEMVRDQIENLFGEMVKMKSTSKILLVSHRVLLIALYAKLQRGRVEYQDWSLVDFNPLCGFRAWLTAEGRVTGTQLLVNH